MKREDAVKAANMLDRIDEIAAMLDTLDQIEGPDDVVRDLINLAEARYIKAKKDLENFLPDNAETIREVRIDCQITIPYTLITKIKCTDENLDEIAHVALYESLYDKYGHDYEIVDNDVHIL
jgi:hypothetical protein